MRLGTLYLTMLLSFCVALTCASSVAASRKDSSGTAFPNRLAASDDRSSIYEVLLDVSCDEKRLDTSTLTNLVDRLTTLAAWREGLLRIGAIRTSTQSNLEFRTIGPFVNKLTDVDQPEPILRGLKKQRDNADVAGMVRWIEAAGGAGCKRDIGTDLLQAFIEVQRDLSSFKRTDGTFGVPVRLYFISNGITVTRAINFRKPQPAPNTLLVKLAAAGMVADLSLASVVLVGIGNADNISDKKVAWLREFWSRYFVKAHVDPIVTARNTEALLTQIERVTR